MNGQLRTDHPSVRTPQRTSSLHASRGSSSRRTSARASRPHEPASSSSGGAFLGDDGNEAGSQLLPSTRQAADPAPEVPRTLPFPSRQEGGSQSEDATGHAPETSAQGAARYTSAHRRVSSGGGHSRQGSHPYPSLHGLAGISDPVSPSLHGTFGRSSHGSILVDRDPASAAPPNDASSSVSRRQSSPTEQSAFGLLATQRAQAGTTRQQSEIHQYLERGKRQQRIDALERELNLPASPLSTEAEEELRSVGSRSPSAPERWERPGPGAGGRDGNRSRSSVQTFGLFARGSTDDSPAYHHRHHREHTATNTTNTHTDTTDTTNSGHARSGDDSARDRSETTGSRVSRDSRPSDRGYGVGEMGGDEHFSPPTRMLEPEQLAASPGRSDPYGSPNVGQPSRGPESRRSMSSPEAFTDPRPISQISSATVHGQGRGLALATTTSAGGSRRRPLSRLASAHETVEAEGSLRERSMSSPEARSGAVRMQAQPSIVQHRDEHGPRQLVGLVRSASVSVWTPTLGKPPSGMPTGQRASFLDGGEQANAVRPARGGGWLGHRLRQSSASRPSATSSGRPRLDSLRARRDPSSQFASRSASLSAQRAQQQRSKERYHFSQVYESRPRFPEEPFASSLQGLEIDSRWARLHHALLPLLVFYHIPLTLFLDFHALFALVEVAVHPDSGQAGATTAWWVAVGIYAASLALWFVGVVIIYEALWQYARRWSVGRPLALPVYLSAPARNLTSIRSFSLFSLLHSARVMAARRDFAIETFWFYSQNWPTVLTLLPRAALCVVLLVLYRTSGPPLATEGTREATIFNAATGRLTTYTFVILLVNAAWAAWRLAVPVASWIGLLVMLGWRSVSERNKDGYSFGSLAGPEHRREGSRRHLFQASDLEDERAHPSDAADAIHQLPRWAWKLRAEDRLRTLLLDASSDAAGDLSGDGVGYGDDPYATRPNSEMVETARWSRLYPADDQPTSMAQVMREGGADADHQMAGHRGQTDPPPAMAPGGGSGLPVPAPAIAFPQDSFDDRDPLDDRLPARAAGGDDASDHYSPVPTPIGRTTRSREQLRSDSLGRAAAWTTLPATASASMPAGADLDLPDRHYGEGSNDDYALYRPTPPTFEPITLASSEDASPDEPLPSDSPILSGRRRIVSMQSSDLHSTNAVLSDMSSPVATRRRASRGQKRPRSSPSAEGHDPEAGATSGAEASQRQGSADVDDAAGSEVGHGAVQGAQGPRGQEHGDVVVNLVEVPLTPAAFSRDAASIILRQSRTRSKDAVADGAESQAPAESRKGSQRAPPSPRMDALLGQDDKATSSPSGSHGFHKLDGSPNLDNGSFSDVKHGNNGGSVSSTMGLGLMGQGSLPRKWPARRWSLTGSRPQSGEGAPSAEASSGAGAGGSKTSPLPSFAGLLPFGGSRNSSRKNVTALDGGASSDELHGVDPEQSRRAGRDSWLSGKDGSHPGSRQSGGGGDGWWTTLFGSTSSISLSRRTELAADVTVATPEKGSPSRRQEQMDPQPSPPSAAAPSWHSTPKASRPTLGADPMPALAGQPLPATPMANATTTTMAEADADAPAGAGAAAPARAALMARTGSSDNSRGSQDSTMSDDSEEGRLWASFPDQSRRHPPGLIALSIEQQIAEARAAAAAYASSLSPSSAAEDTSTSTSTPRPVSIASPALATPPPAGSSSPHMASLSSSLSEMPLSPSLGGLHAIREESWSSSLESGADTSASDAGDESRPSLPRRRGVLHDEPLEHLTNGPERSEAEVATPRH